MSSLPLCLICGQLVAILRSLLMLRDIGWTGSRSILPPISAFRSPPSPSAASDHNGNFPVIAFEISNLVRATGDLSPSEDTDPA
ncbi:hypothetical protein OE88DRAFT_1661832 [Heliocybe sulcata]|uniref:Secreted protein n=1 Tax=Heliocybe sulcata TaxID=5364 RepID=A0A5C3MYU4_9AGAM|nr:hypothetical protein OE88DRAFT_1661832 [Heliocybe sulcata]